MAAPAAKPKNQFLGAIMDLVILALLLGAAGFGGYFWGINQRLAPVAGVAPGTPGALPAPVTPPPATTATPATTTAAASTSTASTATAATTPATSTATNTAATPTTTQAEKSPKSDKLKYWLSSSGEDYTGYSITVSVNGTAVDNFFGPGKNVDISKRIKSGENEVSFDAKALGDQYNKHKGDAKACLKIDLVKGKSIQEDYKKDDVVLSYERNASESDSFNDTEHFTKE